MDFLRRKPVAITISFAVTVIALWIALRGVNLRDAARAIASMHALPLFIAFLIFVFGTYLRALRWHIMMRKNGSTLTASIEAVLVSLFFTGILPLRTGEVVRVGYFARRTGAPVMSVAAALVLERTLDIVSLAVIAAIFLSGAAGEKLPGLPVPPWMLGAGAGAVVTGMIIFGFRLAARMKKTGRAGPPKTLLARWFDEGLQGLQSLGSKGVAATVLLLSLGMWLITVLPGKFVFLAVDRNLPYTDLVIILLGVAFAIAAPSSPGFVGTYHAGFVLSSQLVGISKEVALPVAIVSHLIAEVPFIIAGGLVLATGGRRLLVKADSAARRGRVRSRPSPL